jgi:protein transport protein SEC24
MHRTSSHLLTSIKDDFTNKCGAILLAYRRQCAASTAPTQVSVYEDIVVPLGG